MALFYRQSQLIQNSLLGFHNTDNVSPERFPILKDPKILASVKVSILAESFNIVKMRSPFIH